MKNWKTTLVGFALIGAGVYMYITTKDWTQPAMCIAAGTGFLLSKDYDKTGVKQQAAYMFFQLQDPVAFSGRSCDQALYAW